MKPKRGFNPSDEAEETPAPAPETWRCQEPGCKLMAVVTDYLGARTCSGHNRKKPELTPRDTVADMVARTKARIPADSDPLAGARRLRAREEAGERLTLAQKELWRTALRREIDAQAWAVRVEQERKAKNAAH